jgi:hypothetical protein
MQVVSDPQIPILSHIYHREVFHPKFAKAKAISFAKRAISQIH